MKYSLHLRTASPKYLHKADEIMVEYRDRRAIPDYIKKYPNARKSSLSKYLLEGKIQRISVLVQISPAEG